jgi:hypothetical protein
LFGRYFVLVLSPRWRAVLVLVIDPHCCRQGRRGHSIIFSPTLLRVLEMHQIGKGGRIGGTAADVKCQPAEFARWCVPSDLHV